MNQPPQVLTSSPLSLHLVVTPGFKGRALADLICPEAWPDRAQRPLGRLEWTAGWCWRDRQRGVLYTSLTKTSASYRVCDEEAEARKIFQQLNRSGMASDFCPLCLCLSVSVSVSLCLSLSPSLWFSHYDHIIYIYICKCNCFKDRLNDRHSCLYPCVLKFNQSISQSVKPSLSLSGRLV